MVSFSCIHVYYILFMCPCSAVWSSSSEKHFFRTNVTVMKLGCAVVEFVYTCKTTMCIPVNNWKIRVHWCFYCVHVYATIISCLGTLYRLIICLFTRDCSYMGESHYCWCYAKGVDSIWLMITWWTCLHIIMVHAYTLPIRWQVHCHLIYS